jgi:3-mercaptopyruvate sulfurtransferase SseA
VCPNEATAKRIVSQLHRKNIHHVRTLKGGLDAWEKRGYRVEALPSGFNTATGNIALADFAGGDEDTVCASLSK